MDIKGLIDQALDVAISIENRNVGSTLEGLIEKLHLLYFDPETTVPILRELAENGRLSSMTRTEALSRFRYSSMDVSSTLTELDDFLRQHGRRILTPSQYAELSSYGRVKRQLRSDIGLALDRDMRFAIDELIKLPARFPNGAEPYDQIKASARDMLVTIEASNSRLDNSHRLLQAAASVPRSRKPQQRWPRLSVVSVLVFLAIVGSGLAWAFARDMISDVWSGLANVSK